MVKEWSDLEVLGDAAAALRSRIDEAGMVGLLVGELEPDALSWTQCQISREQPCIGLDFALEAVEGFEFVALLKPPGLHA